MAGYVALVRGINVGGNKQVKMVDLRTVFEAAGYENVSTYLQSGNVIFETDGRRSPDRLAGEIEAAIEAELSVEVDVVLRTARDLSEVLETNPFPDAEPDPRFLHVTFLADEPDPATLEDLDVPTAGEDEFQIIGREVFLHCPEGYGKTKLNNALWERKLRVPATTRNWNTVTKLAELTPGG